MVTGGATGGGGVTIAPANATVMDPEKVKNSDATSAIAQAKGQIAVNVVQLCDVCILRKRTNTLHTRRPILQKRGVKLGQWNYRLRLQGSHMKAIIE